MVMPLAAQDGLALAYADPALQGDPPSSGRAVVVRAHLSSYTAICHVFAQSCMLSAHSAAPLVSLQTCDGAGAVRVRSRTDFGLVVEPLKFIACTPRFRARPPCSRTRFAAQLVESLYFTPSCRGLSSLLDPASHRGLRRRVCRSQAVWERVGIRQRRALRSPRHCPPCRYEGWVRARVRAFRLAG